MSAIFITPELAYQLERTEARHLARQVETCAHLRPELGAHVIPAAGGIAAFTAGEYGRKLNHVTGFGLGVSVTENELIKLEEAYGKLGLPTEIDLCPFVNHEVLELLAARSYAVNAFSNTYVKALDQFSPILPVNPSVKIELLGAASGQDFLAASIAGFSGHHNRPPTLIQTLAKIAMARDDSRLYIARVDGEIAGTAGLGLIDLSETTVAHLYIASTLPAYRGRGVQQALIRARLADARRAGAKLASITSRPGNVSSGNAVRSGFELAYTKSTFTSRPPKQ